MWRGSPGLASHWERQNAALAFQSSENTVLDVDELPHAVWNLIFMSIFSRSAMVQNIDSFTLVFISCVCTYQTKLVEVRGQLVRSWFSPPTMGVLGF